MSKKFTPQIIRLRPVLGAVAAIALQPATPVAAYSLDAALLWRAALDGSPGWVTEEYAMPDANRCMVDTSGYYGSDRDDPGTGLGLVHEYRQVEVKSSDCMPLQGLQPQQHLEGVARIPYPGREILYFSYIDHGVDDDEILDYVSYFDDGVGENVNKIARVDVRESEHLTEDEFLLHQSGGRDAELKYCKNVGDSLHVGGMQALGDYLFAGVEDKDGHGRVDIFRVKDGDTLFGEGQITLRSVPMPHGEKAHYVMATRLRDGRYFMAVNRANDGDFSLFWAAAPMASWEYIGDQRFPELGDWSSEGKRYQSANFVTDCAGRLYIVALGQQLGGTGWRNPNEVFMYAVTLRRDPANRPYVEGLENVGFFAKDYGANHCEMRGAGGAHITPSGKLSLYCGPDREFEASGHDFYFSSIRPPE